MYSKIFGIKIIEVTVNNLKIRCSQIWIPINSVNGTTKVNLFFFFSLKYNHI